MVEHIKYSMFPDPDMADEDGLICIGANLDVSTLLDAYYHGIFPWPREGVPTLWFCPPQRGVLDFSRLHIPRSLKKFRKSWNGEFRIDTAFRKVIKACQEQPRPGQDGTWILPKMINAYTKFHAAGYAHSIEAWEDGMLTGGIYGVFVGNVFSGESMFYKKYNRSKLCLWYMAEHLQQIGIDWMDIQMLTPLTQSFGGEYIEREEFIRRVFTAHSKPEIAFMNASRNLNY
jgi:leucyl/phenylalanyl-tRNA---protein transferase